MRVCALVLAAAVLLGGPLSFKAGAAEAQLEVGAEAYIVIDADTGQVLVEKNAHMQAYPASITKILTLALALESIRLEADADKKVPVSQEAVDALIPRATQVALIPGEEAPLLDLLYATMIESANDAAHVLAEHVGGSMQAFAGLMNEKAAALGLTGSSFQNPSGQPDAGHTTTAYDMANITRWALTVPDFRLFFSATEHAMAPTDLQPAGRQFHSANLLLLPFTRLHCQGVTGSKTGYTDDAQYTMVTSAKRGDTELICVVLKCATNEMKYADTNALLDYCFGNFRRVTYPGADVDAGTVPVYGGAQQPLGDVRLAGAADVSFLLHNSLDISAVQLYCEVPERYVIGEAFSPTAVLTLPQEWAAQNGALANVPLEAHGLEELLAANTRLLEQAQPAEAAQGTRAWLWALVPLLLVALCAARILYVRQRRKKRRMARLAAVRARRPISIAERPRPPQRTAMAVGAAPPYRRQATPAHAARHYPQAAPRRAGRAR
ncbi:MAG: D-alanyl-D-alanine carboxypeptidase family protein [Oscillospiraceae bacterium]